jgi:hypothetical protein
MANHAYFRVDPRLAQLLGESYRSTEQALRELVDNAWDADADTVRISLPQPMTDAPIVVADDGSGMTEEEVRRHYLTIANDRYSRRGTRTTRYARLVRGRKGIGKFAGLVATEDMRVETWSRGKKTSLNICKSALLQAKGDLERIDLPIAVEDCDADAKGTTITLSQLNSRFAVPLSEALKEILALEYGRCSGFAILVNNEPLSHEDIQGQVFTKTVELPGAGKVTLRFTVMTGAKGARHAGIITRVGGKVVGKPSMFGLDNQEEIPRKLLNRIVGEIEADGLEGDVTADWGALFENSTAYQAVQQWANENLKDSVSSVFSQEVSLARARRQKKIDEVLSKLPEYRRPYATKALDRVLRRFYGESEERIDVLISLVLEAFEKDEYWTVCQRIQEAKQSDVALLADALQEFGLVDIAYITQQARRRLQFLDELDALARNDATLESAMHQALETNLWVFGPEYSLMASNQTLAATIKHYCDEKFKGPRSVKRPDLFLAQNVLARYLLIEFKRPSHAITRDDENQAEKYRDDLMPRFSPIDILVVGGSVSSAIQRQYVGQDIKLLSFETVISTARTQLGWLIQNLQCPPA